MRKTLMRTGLGLVLAFCFASAKSSGIPVVDVTAIANMVKQYAQMVEQYKVLQSQLATTAKQLEGATGARGMGALFSNPEVQSMLPPEWADLYGSVGSSPYFKAARKKFPVSKNPRINAIYDQAAATDATMQDFFKRTQLRIVQIQKLQSKIDSAPDPAAKADLQNRLEIEQNSISASSQLMAAMQKLADQDAATVRRAAHKDLLCSEFKNCPAE